MSYQCDICHKGSMRGNLVSHSKQRAHRFYRPNLHSARAIINGVGKRVRVCTKCLRKIKRKTNLMPKTLVKPVVPLTVTPEIRPPAEKPIEQKPQEVKVKKTTVEELMKESASAKTTEEKAKKTTKRGRPKKLHKPDKTVSN